MRSVDAINGEIGQLEGQIKKHEARIHELRLERAEVDLTGKGYGVGKVIEFPHGKGTRKGRIVGFSYNGYWSELKLRTIKKDGKEGEVQLLSEYRLGSAKIVEDAPCAS